MQKVIKIKSTTKHTLGLSKSSASALKFGHPIFASISFSLTGSCVSVGYFAMDGSIILFDMQSQFIEREKKKKEKRRDKNNKTKKRLQTLTAAQCIRRSLCVSV